MKKPSKEIDAVFSNQLSARYRMREESMQLARSAIIRAKMALEDETTPTIDIKNLLAAARDGFEMWAASALLPQRPKMTNINGSKHIEPIEAEIIEDSSKLM